MSDQTAQNDRDQATVDRAQATTDRYAATTDRDAATTDRGQATTDRGQATTDRDQAATDRDQATVDRAQATTDRMSFEKDRRLALQDIAGLAVEVGQLGAMVSDLSKLIKDSLARSEEVAAATARNTKTKASKGLLYGLAGNMAIVVVLLAVVGGLLLNQINRANDATRKAAFQSCLLRNMSQQTQSNYLALIQKAVNKARGHGDVLAKELDGLITPATPPRTVNCATFS